jgi:hypothetical protein
MSDRKHGEIFSFHSAIGTKRLDDVADGKGFWNDERPQTFRRCMIHIRISEIDPPGFNLMRCVSDDPLTIHDVRFHYESANDQLGKHVSRKITTLFITDQTNLVERNKSSSFVQHMRSSPDQDCYGTV